MSQVLVDEWAPLGEACARGVGFGVARRVVGCPVRFSIGGVSGNRPLVLTPELVTWQLRRGATGNHCSPAEVDRRRAPLDSLPQRAKQPPSGGATTAYSSTSGFPRELPSMWREETAVSSEAGPSFAARTDGKSTLRYYRYGL